MLENVLNRLKLAVNLKEVDAWRYATNSRIVSEKIKQWILDQLDDGLNANDEIIGIYSYATEQMSEGRKRAGEPYNLDDTGYFRSTIGSYSTDEYIVIVANGQKVGENIIDKYSVRIIELTPEHTILFKDFVMNEYLIYVRNVLQIN